MGIFAIVFAAFGCGPNVSERVAPFRARPDSVQAGRIAGPFSGKVVEAASGRPVAGALIYATWSYEEGYGSAQPAGHREHLASTDATGYYNIPRISGGRGRLTGFRMVIYKRGFVAYRSDRRFSDLGLRTDFAQANNTIRLVRWRQGMSHARHLRYVGGGAAIKALTAWEVEEAAEELETGASNTKIASPLRPGASNTGHALIVAGNLLTETMIKEITGYDGDFETGPLGDEPDTGAYSSQHFKASGQPETFDIALRIWQLSPSEAKQRYGQLEDTLPDADDIGEIATRSLRAKQSGIVGVAFYDEDRGIVVMLTCGEKQCATEGSAIEIARKIYASIESLWPIIHRGGVAP